MVRTAWFRRASLSVASGVMACFGITGMASAQTVTSSIKNTGANSKNVITSTTTNSCNVKNNNNVSVTNSNNQTATSGNANSSQNTSAGLPWTGWSSMDPSTAQSGGEAYAPWWGSVLSWVTQRATGDGWNSSNSNLAWTPATSDWAGMDPMVWQQNGQSFQNWFNTIQSYMNNNSAGWMLTWPTDAIGNGDVEGGASTGNASNFNSTNFSISIHNNVPQLAQNEACGTSTSTLPSGGMGSGYISTPGMGASYTSSYSPARSYGGSGSSTGGSARYYSSYTPAKVAPVSAPAVVSASAPIVNPVSPVVPPAPPVAPAVNSISNTGYNSHNVIADSTSSSTNVTNNNNVSSYSLNTQNASTGNANSSENTSTASAGTGNASNGNASGAGVGIDN